MRTFSLALFTALTLPLVASADVVYQIDDGTAELTVGIDPGEDTIWMNTFPVAPGGERITSISAAFGRPGLPQSLNGLVVTALLYEDPDGGSPQNAVLKASADGVISLANTNLFNSFPITPTEVHGNMAVAILFRNETGSNRPISALDRTPPDLAGRSWTGFTENGMNEANLLSIPAGQFMTIEGFGFPGNFMVRANGTPVPEPGVATMIAVVVAPWMGVLSRRRVR